MTLQLAGLQQQLPYPKPDVKSQNKLRTFPGMIASDTFLSAQTLFAKRSSSLKVARQSENDDNQENQSQTAARPVSPAGTIRPCWECPNQQKDKDDQ
jgi:hypothetical protein